MPLKGQEIGRFTLKARKKTASRFSETYEQRINEVPGTIVTGGCVENMPSAFKNTSINRIKHFLYLSGIATRVGY